MLESFVINLLFTIYLCIIYFRHKEWINSLTTLLNARTIKRTKSFAIFFPTDPKQTSLFSGLETPSANCKPGRAQKPGRGEVI